MPLNLKFVSSWIMPNSTSIPRIQLCESQPHQPWEIAECEEEVVKFVSITIKTQLPNHGVVVFCLLVKNS